MIAPPPTAEVCFDGATVRTTTIDGEPWFVASDVCVALGIGNVSLAVNGNPTRGDGGIDADEKGVCTVNTLGGAQEFTTVNESGLYSMIFKSRKPEAKRFKKWVTGEVLPAIRKTGNYSAASAIDPMKVPNDPAAMPKSTLVLADVPSLHSGLAATGSLASGGTWRPGGGCGRARRTREAPDPHRAGRRRQRGAGCQHAAGHQRQLLQQRVYRGVYRGCVYQGGRQPPGRARQQHIGPGG